MLPIHDGRSVHQAYCQANDQGGCPDVTKGTTLTTTRHMV